MHVSERPVVYPRPFKIFERAGRVVHMGSIATDIGVHQTDRERFGISFAETQRQVVVDVLCRIAYAVNDRAIGIVLEYLHAFSLRIKARTAWRVVQPRLPAVERIVVAVADEGPYTGIVQPFQALDELELGAQAPVGRVEHVASDQKRVHTLVDAQVDDVLVGAERRILQRAGHVFGRDGLNTNERTVQMQISGMYKAKTGHVCLLAPGNERLLPSRQRR